MQKSNSNKHRPGMGTHQKWQKNLDKLSVLERTLFLDLSKFRFYFRPENFEEREVHMCFLVAGCGLLSGFSSLLGRRLHTAIRIIF